MLRKGTMTKKKKNKREFSDNFSQQGLNEDVQSSLRPPIGCTNHRYSRTKTTNTTITYLSIWQDDDAERMRLLAFLVTLPTFWAFLRMPSFNLWPRPRKQQMGRENFRGWCTGCSWAVGVCHTKLFAPRRSGCVTKMW